MMAAESAAVSGDGSDAGCMPEGFKETPCIVFLSGRTEAGKRNLLAAGPRTGRPVVRQQFFSPKPVLRICSIDNMNRAVVYTRVHTPRR